MDKQFTPADFELILTSFRYTRMNFENTQYPTYELRQSQLKRVEDVIDKVRAIRDELLKAE